MKHRPKIAEFQRRLKGRLLAHGTHRDLLPGIRARGLHNAYNYSCIDKGWEMHDEDSVDVYFSATAVADRTYPDPEGQWGSNNYSMQETVDRLGLDAVLDELEDCFSGKGWMEDFGEDVLDPANYNLVTIGPIGPWHIKFEKGN